MITTAFQLSIVIFLGLRIGKAIHKYQNDAALPNKKRTGKCIKVDKTLGHSWSNLHKRYMMTKVKCNEINNPHTDKKSDDSNVSQCETVQSTLPEQISLNKDNNHHESCKIIKTYEGKFQESDSLGENSIIRVPDLDLQNLEENRVSLQLIQNEGVPKPSQLPNKNDNIGSSEKEMTDKKDVKFKENTLDDKQKLDKDTNSTDDLYKCDVNLWTTDIDLNTKTAKETIEKQVFEREITQDLTFVERKLKIDEKGSKTPAVAASKKNKEDLVVETNVENEKAIQNQELKSTNPTLEVRIEEKTSDAPINTHQLSIGLKKKTIESKCFKEKSHEVKEENARSSIDHLTNNMDKNKNLKNSEQTPCNRLNKSRKKLESEWKQKCNASKKSLHGIKSKDRETSTNNKDTEEELKYLKEILLKKFEINSALTDCKPIQRKASNERSNFESSIELKEPNTEMKQQK